MPRLSTLFSRAGKGAAVSEPEMIGPTVDALLRRLFDASDVLVLMPTPADETEEPQTTPPPEPVVSGVTVGTSG